MILSYILTRLLIFSYIAIPCEFLLVSARYVIHISPSCVDFCSFLRAVGESFGLTLVSIDQQSDVDVGSCDFLFIPAR